MKILKELTLIDIFEKGNGIYALLKQLEKRKLLFRERKSQSYKG